SGETTRAEPAGILQSIAAARAEKGRRGGRVRRRDVAAIAYSVVCSCAPDTVSVVINPMSEDRCREFCVDTLEIELGDRKISAACGAPVELQAIEAGTTTILSIRTIGHGFELRGAAEVTPAAGTATKVDLALTPTA